MHDTPIRLDDLAYVAFEKPDPDRLTRFLIDFGLSVRRGESGALLGIGGDGAHHCYVARAGTRSRFIGFGVTVPSPEELERAARRFGAPVTEAPAWLGGGRRLALTDPNGVALELVNGMRREAWMSPVAPLPSNSPLATPRVNQARSVPEQMPRVHRLGHVVLDVVRFQQSLDWYRRHFGLIASDLLLLPDGKPAAAFLRFDRGERPSDHHSIVLAANVADGLNHCAFEMQDLEAVALGQQQLKRGGWRHAWGLGRHILGSQLFDYWRDPWGDMMEHYADGDRFDARQPTGTHRFNTAGIYQWGTDLPQSFLGTRLTWSKLRSILHHLRHTPEFTLQRAMALKQAVSAPARPWL